MTLIYCPAQSLCYVNEKSLKQTMNGLSWYQFSQYEQVRKSLLDSALIEAIVGVNVVF